MEFCPKCHEKTHTKVELSKKNEEPTTKRTCIKCDTER